MLPQLSSDLVAPPSGARPLIVLKLGGDAVATPERIALAAQHVLSHSHEADVIVVTSARRGVTDQLTRLALGVGESLGLPLDTVETERAIASGELVTASLMAAALTRLGRPARSLDAREAGLVGRERDGQVHLARVRCRRLRRELRAGVIPVVAGFQVIVDDRLRTLGRGGSDITAVGIAAALGATECHFLKQRGLRERDPRIDPAAPSVDLIDFSTFRALLASCGQVLHIDAARLADRHDVPLHFVPFPEPGPTSRVAPRERCA